MSSRQTAARSSGVRARNADEATEGLDPLPASGRVERLEDHTQGLRGSAGYQRCVSFFTTSTTPSRTSITFGGAGHGALLLGAWALRELQLPPGPVSWRGSDGAGSPASSTRAPTVRAIPQVRLRPFRKVRLHRRSRALPACQQRSPRPGDRAPAVKGRASPHCHPTTRKGAGGRGVGGGRR